MLAIKVDLAKCDGCGRCTVACEMGGALSKERQGAGMRRPLLWIIESAEKCWIDICRHCEAPVCADACVAGAISPDHESGTVQVAAEKCIGCWSCVMECPFKALRLVDGRAVKCDGCRALDAPLCARFCPTGALKAAFDSRGIALRRRRERAAILGRAGT